jgi:two-component system NtrC family sensor kinase
VRESVDQECSRSLPPGGNSPSRFRSVLIASSVAETIATLPWLAPDARSLTLLARPDPEPLWPRLCTDPGAVLLLVEQLQRNPAASLERILRDDPALLERAEQRLREAPAGVANWSEPGTAPLYRKCLACARLAWRLAEKVAGADPERAWICGLLAPLGWLALAAVAPALLSSCLPACPPAESETARPPFDPAQAGRRLACHWRLPGWLKVVVGHLGLPIETACKLGGDPVLFALTRLAVAQERTEPLSLHLIAAQGFLDAQALGLSPEEVESASREEEPTPVLGGDWQSPYTTPLLPEVLGLAAENRHLRRSRARGELEQTVDCLQEALERQIQSQDKRLQEEKLEALAEFSAGASHEINNPLAVISGQAQYLLAHLPGADVGSPSLNGYPSLPETGPDNPPALTQAGFALEVIIAQTRRIHGILRDLRQFARPSPAHPSLVDLPALLAQVAASLDEFAGQRQVRVEVVSQPERLTVWADIDQLRTVLTSLLRNAIEAAPPEGWARLGIRDEPGQGVQVFVEDNGPGPDPLRKHALFDPFYSGRNAGRGRGLGLPLAWRLARLQGGDVWLEERDPGAPTRFTLSLPGRAGPDLSSSLSNGHS